MATLRPGRSLAQEDSSGYSEGSDSESGQDKEPDEFDAPIVQNIPNAPNDTRIPKTKTIATTPTPPVPDIPGIPEPVDQGGFGGAPPPNTNGARTARSTKIEARLRNQIKHFTRTYPKIDIFATTKIDQELAHLDEDELKAMLDSCKQQVGGVSPYATAQTITNIAGTILEKKLRVPGYAQALSADVDVICALDDLIPDIIQNVGAPLSLAWKLISIYLVQTGNIPQVEETIQEPPRKKRKKNARPSNSTPNEDVGDGPFPHGEDHLHREVDSE